MLLSTFNKTVNKKTDINPNRVQITKHYLENMGLGLNMKFSDFSRYSTDLKGPKEKYLNCTMDGVRGCFFRVATQHNISCSDNQ